VEIRGAIIAGGQAARHGSRPKGLERVGGERILDRLVATFEAALGAQPLLVANAPEASAWRPGLRVVADLLAGSGPVIGIYTAILAAPAPVVCVAWDMPFVTAPLLRALADGLSGADACLPESGGPRGLEPLCAAYGPAAGPAIAAALAAGERSAVGFHDRIKLGILSSERVRAFGDPAVLFFNVNTPDDLAEADRLWRTLASSQ
jgi:molybdopterin-guanine dinucleotide biosynthesis protein A